MPFELRQIGEPSPRVRISASNCAQSQTMWRGESHLIWHKTAPVAFNVEIDRISEPSGQWVGSGASFALSWRPPRPSWPSPRGACSDTGRTSAPSGRGDDRSHSSSAKTGRTSFLNVTPEGPAATTALLSIRAPRRPPIRKWQVHRFPPRPFTGVAHQTELQSRPDPGCADWS